MSSTRQDKFILFGGGVNQRNKFEYDLLKPPFVEVFSANIIPEDTFHKFGRNIGLCKFTISSFSTSNRGVMWMRSKAGLSFYKHQQYISESFAVGALNHHHHQSFGLRRHWKTLIVFPSHWGRFLELAINFRQSCMLAEGVKRILFVTLLQFHCCSRSSVAPISVELLAQLTTDMSRSFSLCWRWW